MESKVKMKIVNNINEKLYAKYKDFFLKILNKNIEILIDFDINLLIKLEKSIGKQKLCNGEVSAAQMYYDNKKYILILQEDSFKRIKYDRGLDLESSIFHELIHIYDSYNIMKNKNYHFILFRKRVKKYDDFVVNIGYRFWTEFLAYFCTYNRFNFLEKGPTMFQLLKEFESCEELYKKIDLIALNKSDKKMCEDLCDRLDAFIYALSKHLAYELSVGRRYSYCKKTKKRSSYIFLLKILKNLSKKCGNIYENRYKKSMAKNLFMLGLYILETIYGYFKINIVSKSGSIKMAFYCD